MERQMSRRRASACAPMESLESRFLFAVAPQQPVARPDFNTGSGFFVRGSQVFDANGYPFTIHGFSHTTWWGNGTKDVESISQFSKTKVNAVRVVFGTGFGP